MGSNLNKKLISRGFNKVQGVRKYPKSIECPRVYYALESNPFTRHFSGGRLDQSLRGLLSCDLIGTCTLKMASEIG